MLAARVPLKDGGSTVQVAHLAGNGSSYVCGVLFEASLSPTLLYPISGLLLPQTPSSHQASPELAITDFNRSYVQNIPLDGVSFEGNYGFQIATALRYLHHVSRFDADIQACFFPNRDRSSVPLLDLGRLTDAQEKLLQALGIDLNSPIKGYRNRLDFIIGDGALVSSCSIRPLIGRAPLSSGALVTVDLVQGAVLPILPSNPEVLVRVSDTSIAGKVDLGKDGDVVPLSEDGDFAAGLLPARILGTALWGDIRSHEYSGFGGGGTNPYPVAEAVRTVRPGTTRFAFQTPNILDGILFGYMLTRSMEPIVKVLRPSMGNSLAQLTCPAVTEEQK